MNGPRTEHRVALLAEGGPGVGLGHLRRCQAVAHALVAAGAEARVLVDGDRHDGDAPAAGTRHAPWLAEGPRVFAGQTPDVVVIDSYAVSDEMFEAFRATGAAVVAIDDVADRRLAVDLVVNGAFHAHELPYARGTSTRFLLGPRYALLDARFASVPARRARTTEIERVLVTFGGETPADLVASALVSLARTLPRADIDLVVGPFTDARALGDSATVRTHRGLSSLCDLIASADVAISGGGMTLYECLASGTPAIGLCLADNQRGNVEAMSRAGLILPGAPSLEAAVMRLTSDPALRTRMSEHGRAAVDGRGAERVAGEITRLRLGAVAS